MFMGICVLIVTVCGLQLADGGATKNSDGYIPIKYPGPIQEVSQNRYGTPDEIPEQCRNKTFCAIKPPDYPQNEFNKMFKGTKIVHQPKLVIDIGDRQGDPDAMDNCETIVSYEPLYKVREKRGEWRTVVQAPEENFLQLVRLETCKETEGSCFMALPQSPDYTTFCKQKYSVWEFLVAKEGGGTEKITAELPICCSCHYKYVTGKK